MCVCVCGCCLGMHIRSTETEIEGYHQKSEKDVHPEHTHGESVRAFDCGLRMRLSLRLNDYAGMSVGIPKTG